MNRKAYPFPPLDELEKAERLRANQERDQRDSRRRSPLQLENVLQALIGILTLTGLYMFGDRDAAVAWIGAWISLSAQPAWLVDSWRSRKFGNLLVSLAMTAIFIRAVYVGW